MKAALKLVSAAALALLASTSMAAAIGKGGGTYDVRAVNASGEAVTAAAGQIQYHGGKVMTNAAGVNVYIIWYGNWSGNTATTIVPEFLSHEGGSPYFGIQTSYYDAAGAHIPNIVNLGAEWADPGYDPGNAHSVPYMWWTTGVG